MGIEMISTVTTIATTTVFGSHAPTLGAIGTGILIILLIARELLDSHDGSGSQQLAEATLIAIIPLLCMFALIAIINGLEAL